MKKPKQLEAVLNLARTMVAEMNEKRRVLQQQVKCPTMTEF